MSIVNSISKLVTSLVPPNSCECGNLTCLQITGRCKVVGNRPAENYQKLAAATLLCVNKIRWGQVFHPLKKSEELCCQVTWLLVRNVFLIPMGQYWYHLTDVYKFGCRLTNTATPNGLDGFGPILGTVQGLKWKEGHAFSITQEPVLPLRPGTWPSMNFSMLNATDTKNIYYTYSAKAVRYKDVYNYRVFTTCKAT